METPTTRFRHGNVSTVGRELRGDGFRIQRVVYAPGYRRSAHAHDTTGITLIIDGAFRETARGTTEEAMSLSVVVKPAGTVHADVVGPRGATTLFVEIEDESALLEEPESFGPWRWLHGGPGVRPLLSLARTLRQPMRSVDPEDLVLELLGEVLDIEAPRESDVPFWVRRAREVLDDSGPEGLRVRDLAAELRVHPVSLTRAFRRSYGLTVTSYRRRARLRRAAREVTGSCHQLGTIAHAVGYADQAHMCREVRDATGLSPTELRDLARP